MYLSYGQMFTPLKWCAEPITQLHELIFAPYLIVVEYLSKLDDVRSVKFNHDYKVMVTSSDQKFEPLIVCPHPIPFTPGMIS